MQTWSFLDVHGAMAGPGILQSINSESATADEGITIDYVEEKNTMTQGSGSDVMHSLHAAKAGHVTIHLLRTSPLNAALSQAYNLQTASSALHGQNIFTISNPVTGDKIVCQNMAFSKHPAIPFGKDGGIMSWEFHVAKIDTSLAGLLI